MCVCVCVRGLACVHQMSCRHYVCGSTRLLVLITFCSYFVVLFFFFVFLEFSPTSVPAVSFSSKKSCNKPERGDHHDPRSLCCYQKNLSTKAPIFFNTDTDSHVHTESAAAAPRVRCRKCSISSSCEDCDIWPQGLCEWPGV